MSLSLKLAKYFMNRSSAEPKFNEDMPFSENIKHNSYINGTEEKRKEMLLKMAAAQYKDEQELPIDVYFPGYNFKSLLKDKTIFDMGCFCGGKAVAYGERWDAKAVHGMDITDDFIKAADLFVETRERKDIDYKFFTGFGENMPIEDSLYDAIISFDVFEHVKSVQETMDECYRILKPGGQLFAAFPSFYSFNESHLGFVTTNPIIHWFFSADTLNQAVIDIMNERDDKETYWYKSTSKEPWQKMGCGIGTNGTTYNSLNKVLKQTKFSNIKFINTPVGSRGLRAQKSKAIRTISKTILNPLNRIPKVRDYISHRIVIVLTK